VVNRAPDPAMGIGCGFSDATIEAQLDIVETSGPPRPGTAAILTGSRYRSGWQRAADNVNRRGAPGDPTAPNQSLQSSQVSYDTIASWRDQ
jgi:hypothetical protein